MLSRLVVAFLALAIARPSHAAPDPLNAQALGLGTTLIVRPRVAGLELSFLPGPTQRRWTLALLSPNGGSSAEVVVRFPPERVAPLVVILPRPTRDVSDGDLRLHLEASGLDLIGRVAPWLEVPRLRVFGDKVVQAGTAYAPRVVVTVPQSGCSQAPCERPLADAVVHARLVLGEGKRRKVIALAGATTDASGSAPIALQVPRGAPEELTLELAMTHLDGVANASQPLRVVSSARILVSTDKPLYQPGQRLHLRLLARDKGTGAAAGGAAAAFSVFDAKGNKVFSHQGKTSPEGVFAAQMDIATLVNVGPWRIRAKVGPDEVERTVQVKPYALPKFKVELSPERTAYHPGESVKGSISGRYFFGEPTRKAKVELLVETFDVAPRELARLTLALDDVGLGRFDFVVPSMLAGQPLLQGAALVQLTARVTDSAGQTEEVRRSLTIFAPEDALQVVALPEAGRLVPRVDNTVYFVVTTPDGAPAPRAKVTVSGAEVKAGGALGAMPEVETDASGIAEWHVTPAGPLALEVDLRTPDGVKAHHRIELGQAAQRSTYVLIRPSDPAPRAGDRIDFEVFVAGAVPFVFVDLVKDGQTLLTLSGPVRGGRSKLSATLAPELAGTVLAHAYAIGDDMEVYADTRPMVVRPADELRVELVAPGKPWSSPGEAVSLVLKVSDRAGHPVLAALGLWAVDEAVFALSELRPGLEQVFFLLEREIMAPKVEIHGFEPDRALFPGPRDPRRPARVLAAAAMPVFGHAQATDSRAGRNARLVRRAVRSRCDGLDRASRRGIAHVGGDRCDVAYGG